MKSITPALLKQLLDQHPERFFLVDVRQPEEHLSFHIGGILIPLPEIGEKHHLIPKDIPVVIYCKRGIRSLLAIQRLEMKCGFTNLINLSGGIEAWIKEDGH